LQNKVVRNLRDQASVLASLVVGVVVWQAIVDYGVIPSFLLPAPTEIVTAIFSSRVNWWANIFATLREAIAGFVLGTALGLLLAVAVTASGIVRKIVMPYIVAIQVLPMVAIAPIIYILVGFNDLSRIILTSLLSFFPVVVGTATGLADVDVNLVYLLKSLGASESLIFYKVRLPNSLPHLFVSLRIAITGATVGAIVAEFVSSNIGLGFLMTTALTSFNIELTYAAGFILTVIGLLLYGLVEGIGRASMPWFRRK